MQIGKGVSTSIIITLISILIFAFVIQLFGMGGDILKPVNQFIKALSIFLGCFFSVRGKNGYLKGGIIGLIATVITYLLFSLFTGSIDLNAMLFVDLLLGIIVGVIAGVVTVNIKKEN